MTIRARIRAALRAGHQSPQDVTATILNELPDEELREALEAALPYLVRDEIRKARHDALSPRVGAREERAAGWRLDEAAQTWEEQRGEPPTPTAVAARSQRLREGGRRGFDAAQAKRERDRALLATPLQVPGGGWTTLGQCTVDDLRAIARGLRERAAENERRADGFDRLAGRLEDAGAATVSDYRGELRGEFVGA